MALIEQVRTTIATYNLLEVGDKLIVGVSGGPDSLALLHILQQLSPEYDLQLHIAHVDHQLRGAASQQDAKFVAGIADKWGLPITTKTADVKSYRQEQGLSLEDAARQIRYNFFTSLRDKLGFDKIAVAHHADDQAETILMKFFRGAGLKGLGGMAPQKDRIIRPLLAATKADIKDYCSQHDLKPRLDRTNLQPVQLRNKIRLELIPLLEEEYNNNLVSTLTRNAHLWRAEDDFLRDYAQRKLEQLTIKQTNHSLVVARDKFKQQHLALQRRILREAVKQLAGDYQDFYHQHIKDLKQLALAGKTGNKLELPRGIVAKLNYNQLIFLTEEIEVRQEYFKVKATPGQIKLPNLGLVVSSKVVDSSYPWQKEINKNRKGFFDFAKVGPEFYIRQREPGDRFYPLGLAGSKKVKDFLIDEKIPRWKRDQIPIFVTAEGKIFWLGKLRIDDRFKVTTATEQILVVEINNLKEESRC